MTDTEDLDLRRRVQITWGAAELKQKFVALDALRGCAAVAVLTGHLAGSFGTMLFPHAYLGVDFFFLLSGFILSYSYQERLDNGLAKAKFMWLRLARLYPLYLLSLLFSLVVSVVDLSLKHRPGHEWVALFLSAAAAVCFFPSPRSLFSGGSLMFPLDPPTWSLFYELLANLMHTLLGRRARDATLVGFTAANGILLAGVVYKAGGLDFGSFTRDLPATICRVLFSYCAGMLVFRATVKFAFISKLSSLGLCVLFVAILRVPLLGKWNSLFDIACGCLMFPIIVAAGASVIQKNCFSTFYRSLGVLSYGIYVLHMPLSGYFAQLWRLVFGKTASGSAPTSGIVYLVILACLVWVLDRFYDTPIRLRLRNLY